MTGRRISRLVLGIALVFALGLLGLASLAGASTPPAAAPVANVAVGGTVPSSVPLANFWLVRAQGNGWTFGHAGSSGSAAGLLLSDPIVAITPTSGVRDYWLAARAGGISLSSFGQWGQGDIMPVGRRP